MGPFTVVHTSIVHKMKSITALNSLLSLFVGGRIETSPLLRPDGYDFVISISTWWVYFFLWKFLWYPDEMVPKPGVICFGTLPVFWKWQSKAIKGEVEPRDPTVKMSLRSEVQTNFSLILQTASAHCSNAASPRHFPGFTSETASVIGKVEVCFSGCWIYCLLDQTGGL